MARMQAGMQTLAEQEAPASFAISPRLDVMKRISKIGNTP